MVRMVKPEWWSVVMVITTTLTTSLTSSSRVVLRDNGYEGVVVALEETLPLSLCPQVIQGLEVSRQIELDLSVTFFRRERQFGGSVVTHPFKLYHLKKIPISSTLIYYSLLSYVVMWERETVALQFTRSR